MKKLFLPILFCLSLVSCSKVTEYEGLFYAFGQTSIHIKTYQGSDDNIQELRRILDTFSMETDNYLESNLKGVYTINNTSENVTVSENLYSCLKQANSLTNELDSYFSLFIGSLSKAWKTALENNQILSQETIESELLKIQSTSLSFLENNTVQKSGNAEIDLGAFAKGYALDLAKKYFQDKSISQYIVDAGSSSILLGEKNTNDGLYTIKIKDLTETYIQAKNICISTSSVHEQSTVINGVRYTHIVSPETGEAKVVNDTVVVLSEGGALGDSLSTSMMLMSIPEVLSIEEEYHVKAIVIRDHKVTYSHKDIQLIY